MAINMKRPREHARVAEKTTGAAVSHARASQRLDQLLDEEKSRYRHARLRVRTLEIERDTICEDMQTLQEQLNATNTESMLKDGQIELLQVSLDAAKIECQRLNTRLMQRDSIVQASAVAKAEALELCFAQKQQAEEVERHLQSLQAQADEREHRYGLEIRVADETRNHFHQQLLAAQKVLEAVRTECEASQAVCEKLGIKCALMASDECQTYATLQLSCCGSFICEACVLAYNKSLHGHDFVQAPGTMTLLRCFTWCSHDRTWTDMSAEEVQADSVKLHWIGCRCKTR